MEDNLMTSCFCSFPFSFAFIPYWRNKILLMMPANKRSEGIYTLPISRIEALALPNAVRQNNFETLVDMKTTPMHNKGLLKKYNILNRHKGCEKFTSQEHLQLRCPRLHLGVCEIPIRQEQSAM